MRDRRRYAGYFGIAALLAGAVVVVAVGAAADPAAPPAEPNTLWHFLGIPQGCDKIKDAIKNKKGDCPCKERKPPLKRIADPANLDSQNPEIKAAAKIKAEEDLAPQKVKAIKYLASVGCGCYPGVRDALLACLGDCTEEVRYQAAVALYQAAGNPCKECERNGCCSAAVMTKLEEMAHGQDEKGCYRESSPRVRAAAENALNACRRKLPPSSGPVSPATVPAPKEVPKELPTGPVPTTPAATAGVAIDPVGSLLGDAPDADRARDIFSDARTLQAPGYAEQATGYAVQAAGYAEADGRDPPATGDTVAAGWLFQRRRAPVCPPAAEGSVRPEEEARPSPGEAAAPGAAAPEGPATAPERPGEEAAPPSNALAGNYGAAAGPTSAAPNMIGDFFGGGAGKSQVVEHFQFSNLSIEQQQNNTFYTTITTSSGSITITNGGTQGNGPIVALNGGTVTFAPGTSIYPILAYNDASGKLGSPALSQVPSGGTLLSGSTSVSVSPNGDSFSGYSAVSAFDVGYPVEIPNPGAGGVVGRTKIADDTSPMPRDRVFFDYSFFDGVPLTPSGVNVNRFTPGFEKTFFGGLMSFEMKVPMATTLDSTIVEGGATDTSQPEFGDMALTWKTLLLHRENWAVSGGLMVAVPTAEDTRVDLPDGTPLVLVRDRSTHVAPFVGFLWTPNERFFAQGFAQWDVEANPNPVFINQVSFNDGVMSSPGLAYAGDLHDRTYQYVDLGAGWWLYRGHDRFRHLTGLALTAELHWDQALKEGDAVTNGNWVIGGFTTGSDEWNATIGAHIEWDDLTTVTMGYCTPLNGGPGREFDGEFRLMLNRRFGAQTRATSTPTPL